MVLFMVVCKTTPPPLLKKSPQKKLSKVLVRFFLKLVIIKIQDPMKEDKCDLKCIQVLWRV